MPAADHQADPLNTEVFEPMPGALTSLNAPHRPPRRDRGGSAVDRIYDSLNHEIVNFIREPGQTIAKNDIAETFGVSQTPVREALLRLEAEGLVDIVPQSRTQVSLIDVQHAWEAHFLRLSVEIEVVRHLSHRITADELAHLRTWVDRQVTELKAGDATAFKIADNSFHAELFDLAGVQGLTRLIDSRRGHYDRIRGLYLRAEERRKVVIKEHRAMLKALEAGDERAAEAAVRVHLGKSLGIVDQIRDAHPDYFLPT